MGSATVTLAWSTEETMLTPIAPTPRASKTAKAIVLIFLFRTIYLLFSSLVNYGFRLINANKKREI